MAQQPLRQETQKAKKSKKLSDEEKARRKEERDRKREEKKREAQREKDKWAQNRQSLLEGREAKSTLASYAGKSSYLHSVGRPAELRGREAVVRQIHQNGGK